MSKRSVELEHSAYLFHQLSLGTADVEAISGKQVADIIDFQAMGNLVLTQLFRKVEMEEGFNQIVLPKGSSTIRFEEVLPGNTVTTESNYAYGGQTITNFPKLGSQIRCDMEAVTSATRELFRDLLLESSKEWSKELELRAQTVCLDLKEGSITEWVNGTIGSSTFVPFISISSVPPAATISSVDYYGGTVKLTSSLAAGTLTFLYSNRTKTTGLRTKVSSPQTLTVKDLMELRATLVTNSINPDICLIHPADLPKLVYDASASGLFLAARLYAPDRDGLLFGEIGQIVDLKVLSSCYLPEGIALEIDSSRLGFDVHKRDLEGTKQIKHEFNQVWYNLWAERQFAVNEDKAVGIVVNAKSGKYPAG